LRQSKLKELPGRVKAAFCEFKMKISKLKAREIEGRDGFKLGVRSIDLLQRRL
jgi:hypothetical protein